jgi:outer membrane biosynthesis protein TonB
MKRLLASQTGVARLAAALSCLIIIVMGSALFAQTTGSVNPNPVQADPLVKQDELPPGGCMPIGLTASGEVVFPFQCKDFLERHKAADRKPAAAEEKPATAEEKPAPAEPRAAAPEEKTVEKQPDSLPPESGKPADKPVETAPPQKRAERETRERAIGPPGCTHFRTYDPESGTYRTYDGHRRSCR